MSEYIKEVNDDNFEQAILQSKTPVLVDFWAPWCGPCRMLAPTVEAIAEQYAGDARVAKLNVDDNPSVVQRYRIQGIPTLILFQGGEEKERIIGVASKEAILRMIDEHATGASS
ncbi:MAG: thioredoxin [Deltaproteobacteria bacterium]|nr:thioredoxin [Deltaproteobacteria bacterium]MBI2540444.1 thioredoxin [Deltaproteobacteria bacterium]